MDNIQTFSLHFFCSLYEKHICLASTTQCLNITQKVSLFKQMIWDTFYLSYIRSGVYAKVLLSFKSRITSNENSNATFLVIFKHCALQGCGALVAHFLRTSVLLFIPIVLQSKKYGISSCKAANYEEERNNKEKVNRSNSRYKRKALAQTPSPPMQDR